MKTNTCKISQPKINLQLQSLAHKIPSCVLLKRRTTNFGLNTYKQSTIDEGVPQRKEKEKKQALLEISSIFVV